jgi:DNA-binding HxlR family transcriptional regulator
VKSQAKEQRPIVRLLALLERRWTLRLIWELRDRPLPYRQLQRACDNVSPTILARRLEELVQAKIVENTPDGYSLTKFGKALGKNLLELSKLARDLGPT